MKNFRFLLGLFLAGPVAVLSAADVPAPTPASPAADAAWAELKALGLLEIKPLPESAVSRREQREWYESQAFLLRDKGVAFFAAFPTDPRRWSVAWRMINRSPAFIQSYGPNYQTDYRDVVADTVAADAWRQRLAELEAALAVAADLPAEVREALDLRRLNQTIREASLADQQNQPADWAGVTRALLVFAAKYPDNRELAPVTRSTMYGYESRHQPKESLAAWQPLADAANGPLAEMAREKINAFRVIAEEIDLRFTALDGREVDLKKLRGKVVLVDFWATWCGPCMVEMPNVKKVYAAYRDRGFEIIGISCDFAPSADLDARKAKAARTGPQVLEFCQANDMPWPEYYDGKKHNEGGNLLAKRFAITGIPASFLIDQSGSVVALNLRGEKLEAVVKRLLKL